LISAGQRLSTVATTVGIIFSPWILMARTFEHILIFEYLIRVKNETRQLAMMR